MSWNIKNNIREVERGLNDVARRQIPFATALAINEVLSAAQRGMVRRLRRVVDNPTPFTLRGVGVKRATKRSGSGAVFVKDIQAAYLRRLEDGGTRLPKRRALLVPVRQRLNKYGNMPRGAVGRVLAKPAVFSGRPKGKAEAPGIYQRIGKGRSSRLRLLVHYARSARYKPGLGFERTVRRVAEGRLPSALRRALVKAVGSAR